METKASILVVDDDESNRESLRRRLERRGYAVLVAVDGKDALRSIDSNRFDLIILDVMMPGMNGLEVLEVLRKTYSATQLPVIMATARDQSEDVVDALNRGANDYVTKPLDFAIVAARVKTQLQIKQSVDQIVALEADLLARNQQLDLANTRLMESAARTASELAAAARVQQAFLPRADPNITGARFCWVFEPCTELAGDSLNIVELDEDHVALYVLDVSGHGVAASLLAVTVTRLLSPSVSGDSLVFVTDTSGRKRIAEPAEVATRLTKNFSLGSTEQFITLFYAVYNTTTRNLSYISAGHPGAIRLPMEGSPVVLNGTGMPIGVGETYEQQALCLTQGDRLYLYSDGVTEAMDVERSLFGVDRLLATLKQTTTLSLTQSLALVKEKLANWQAGAASKDDISMLAMQCL